MFVLDYCTIHLHQDYFTRLIAIDLAAGMTIRSLPVSMS